jgi:Asp-tRNA(Asn)/Glu-tRNA(Gln) amidotransferase A subunit family amidase
MSGGSSLPPDAHDLAAQVRAGERSAREQVEAAIARVEMPSGLRIGVQLVAAAGREDLLVSVAARLEEVYGWVGRTPPRGAFA